MANALTVLRIVLSLALLVPAALSPTFLIMCALAGLTDTLDGYVARRTNGESELGATLDSIADLVLVVVCLVKILPVISVRTWLWVWIAMIVLVKATNVISGFVVERRLAMLHTTANKVAGFVVFLAPFAISTFGVVATSIPACVLATFAAVQEGHLIRTGQS